MSESDSNETDEEKRRAEDPRTEQKLIIVGYYPTQNKKEL